VTWGVWAYVENERGDPQSQCTWIGDFTWLFNYADRGQPGWWFIGEAGRNMDLGCRCSTIGPYTYLNTDNIHVIYVEDRQPERYLRYTIPPIHLDVGWGP
jgi:hypothetical protein